MALAFLNACIWTAASSGTGDFVVSAASTGYFTPAQCSNPAVVDGSIYRYFARQGSDHEEGYGVYTASGTTLARTTILSSSNAGAKVSFASAPTVFMGGPLAQDLFAPGQVLGTSTNDNASTGNVGEVLSSVILVGSGAPLTTDTVANFTSMSVTAGDWDLWAEAWFTAGTGTSMTYFDAFFGTTSATLPSTPSIGTARAGGDLHSSTSISNSTVVQNIGPARVSLASPTTYYMGGRAGFSGGTLTGYGKLIARRAR